MGPRLILFRDPRIQIGLQLLDRTIHLLAERNTIEFVDAGGRVRLYIRNGYDFADRFPRIVEAIKTCRCAPASSMAKWSWSIRTACRSSISCAIGSTTTLPCCVP